GILAGSVCPRAELIKRPRGGAKAEQGRGFPPLLSGHPPPGRCPPPPPRPSAQIRFRRSRNKVPKLLLKEKLPYRWPRGERVGWSSFVPCISSPCVPTPHAPRAAEPPLPGDALGSVRFQTGYHTVMTDSGRTPSSCLCLFNSKFGKRESSSQRAWPGVMLTDFEGI
ncbi:hypothetical protein MC885_006956, partial [Smutsia gigantea]